MTDIDIMEIDDKVHSLVDQQKYPEALKLANENVSNEPDSDDAYFLRSYANAMWGQFDQAVSDVKRAASIEPNNAAYYNFLGLLYIDMERYEEALSEFSRALHIEPDNLEYISNLSKAKVHLGDVDSALMDVEKMYRSNTDNDVLRENLASIYSIASYKDWHYVKDDNAHFALSHEHIDNAEKFISKARALSVTDDKVLAKLDEVDNSIKISKKRKFTGGWGTLLMALYIALISIQSGEPLANFFGLSALLYYYALRTPGYVMNYYHFAGDNGIGIGDRIASLFVTDGMVFFSSSTAGAMIEQQKMKLFFGILRAVIRLLFLPITVITGLFKNYPKNHASSILAGMLIVVVIMFLAR